MFLFLAVGPCDGDRGPGGGAGQGPPPGGGAGERDVAGGDQCRVRDPQEGDEAHRPGPAGAHTVDGAGGGAGAGEGHRQAEEHRGEHRGGRSEGRDRRGAAEEDGEGGGGGAVAAPPPQSGGLRNLRGNFDGFLLNLSVPFWAYPDCQKDCSFCCLYL